MTRAGWMLLCFCSLPLAGAAAWSPLGGESPHAWRPLGPVQADAYGPGVNADAAGRPFVYATPGQPLDPLLDVRPHALGPDAGLDQYGRPALAQPFNNNTGDPHHASPATSYPRRGRR